MRETLDLAGQWSFALDPGDVGIDEQWQMGDLAAAIQVPGSWEEQGFGDPPATHPLGGWSKHHQYEGAAWYHRLIDIPSQWADKSIQLQLKGVRWRSQVWLDGQEVGAQESLSTPHVYDLTPFVQPGSSHHLSIRLDNRMIYPLKESHINSEHTATRWGGITGGALLEALPLTRFQQVICRPQVAGKRFDFDCRASSDAALTVDVTLTDPATGATYQTSARDERCCRGGFGRVGRGRAALVGRRSLPLHG